MWHRDTIWMNYTIFLFKDLDIQTKILQIVINDLDLRKTDMTTSLISAIKTLISKVCLQRKKDEDDER